MEPRVVKPPGQDLVVERLKSRYGLVGGCLSEPGRRRQDVAERRRRPPRTPEDLDIFSCGDKVGPSLRCFSDERRRHPASPRGVLTVNWQVHVKHLECCSVHRRALRCTTVITVAVVSFGTHRVI